MKDIGIVGLPFAGKTTLFNALTRAGVADKAARRARAGVKEAALEATTLAKARDLLDQGTPLRAATWEPEELKVLRNFAPLTLKPVLAVVNLGEDEAAQAGEVAQH